MCKHLGRKKISGILNILQRNLVSVLAYTYIVERITEKHDPRSIAEVYVLFKLRQTHMAGGECACKRAKSSQ